MYIFIFKDYDWLQSKRQATSIGREGKICHRFSRGRHERGKICVGVFPKTGITRFRLAYDSLRNTAYCEYPTASPVALLHLKVPDFCVPTGHKTELKGRSYFKKK